MILSRDALRVCARFSLCSLEVPIAEECDVVWTVGDVLIAFAPAAFWLWYARREDVREPEPRLLVLFAFVLGCGAANVIGIVRPRLEFLAPSVRGFGGELVDAFLVTALPEELVKLAAVCLASLWSRNWNEPMDGIVYGIAAGLGFASLENVYFLVAAGDPMIVVGRAFTANLAHAAFTGGAAFLIGLARLRHRFGVVLATAGFAAAVFLHGLYDLFLFSLPAWNLVSLLLVLPLALVLLGLKIRWAGVLRARAGAAGSLPVREHGPHQQQNDQVVT
jgi:protease PrsW